MADRNRVMKLESSSFVKVVYYLPVKSGLTMYRCRHSSCVRLLNQELLVHVTLQCTWLFHALGSKNCKLTAQCLYLYFIFLLQRK